MGFNFRLGYLGLKDSIGWFLFLLDCWAYWLSWPLFGNLRRDNSWSTIERWFFAWGLWYPAGLVSIACICTDTPSQEKVFNRHLSLYSFYNIDSRHSSNIWKSQKCSQTNSHVLFSTFSLLHCHFPAFFFCSNIF